MGSDRVYKKVINNASLGSKRKQFRIQFVKASDFFDHLQRLGIRKSNEKYENLVNFLSIDSSVYKKGLVLKKIEKLLRECQSNEFLRSVGLHKRPNMLTDQSAVDLHVQIKEAQNPHEEESSLDENGLD